MGFTTDFKVRYSEDRGVYFTETDRALIYLPMHESLDDIYKTINHETYHYCFSEIEGLTMDEDQEERLIFQLAWAEYLG